jgi:hypothetical protein
MHYAQAIKSEAPKHHMQQQAPQKQLTLEKIIQKYNLF